MNPRPFDLVLNPTTWDYGIQILLLIICSKLFHLIHLQLAEEKEASERDKWEILKKAQVAAERCVEFKTECDAKDQRIMQLEAQLNEVLTDICSG